MMLGQNEADIQEVRKRDDFGRTESWFIPDNFVLTFIP
jgi:hypothetical protein